jgi:hypothetical protein
VTRGAAILIVLALAACEGAGAAREPATAGDAPAWSADAQTLYQRTLVRDPAPSCAALSAGLSDPAAALLEVAEGAEAPPSSPIRAATCAIREHPARSEAAMLRWVRERRTMGLGLLVLDHLDRLEPELAARLAGAAMSGEFPERARPRIERQRPELLAPVEAPQDPLRAP